MKKKMTKKSIVFIIVGILLLLMIPVVYFSYQYYMGKQEEEKKQEIKDHFYQVATILEDSPIYEKVDENYVEAGTISKNVTIRLKEEEIKTSKDSYFLIEDTPYYIPYRVVGEGQELPFKSDIYVGWNEEISTKENTTITTEQGTITFQKPQTLQVMRKTDTEYDVLFQGHWVKVLKDQIETTTPIEEEQPSVAKKISVLHYTKIDDKKLTEQITWLKEQGYTCIQKDDYLDFINGRIQLKEKVVLLSFDNVTESEQTILDENGITYMNTSDLDSKWLDKEDATTLDKKYYAYPMENNIDQAKMAKILNGENVYVPPAPPTPTTPSQYATQVAVLNYHFFYDGSRGNHCGETICLDSRKFEEQLKYLKDNGYKTLTIEEYRAWIYGEIEVPRKSVLLTIDDGAMGTGKENGNQLIPLLEKYDLHATLFLITAWWPKENYSSPNLDVESHGYDLHISATCNGSSKARALCLSKQELVSDLQESIRLLGTKTAFCYPFYSSNETVRQATKEAGFALGFGGGNVKSTRNSNKYLIPRYPIYDSITMNQFKNMIGG